MDVIRGFFVILFDTLPCLTLTFNGIRDNISTATLETFTSLQERMLEMFYLNSTLHFGIPPVASIGIPVRSLLCGRPTSKTGLTAQQKGTTARWYSNKTYLSKLISIKVELLFLG